VQTGVLALQLQWSEQRGDDSELAEEVNAGSQRDLSLLNNAPALVLEPFALKT
jgi:hypothetical protein